MDLSDSRTQTFHLLDSRLKLFSTFLQTYYKRNVRSVLRILDLESRNVEVLNIIFILLFAQMFLKTLLDLVIQLMKRFEAIGIRDSWIECIINQYVRNLFPSYFHSTATPSRDILIRDYWERTHTTSGIKWSFWGNGIAQWKKNLLHFHNMLS